LSDDFDYEETVILSLPEQALQLSVQITEIVRNLQQKKARFPLCERLLECGLQVGLVLRDYDTELPEVRVKNAGRAAELAREADYILEMAETAGYLEKVQSAYIRSECMELKESALAEKNRNCGLE
jgi:hypothetical protein